MALCASTVSTSWSSCAVIKLSLWGRAGQQWHKSLLYYNYAQSGRSLDINCIANRRNLVKFEFDIDTFSPDLLCSIWDTNVWSISNPNPPESPGLSLGILLLRNFSREEQMLVISFAHSFIFLACLLSASHHSKHRDPAVNGHPPFSCGAGLMEWDNRQ